MVADAIKYAHRCKAYQIHADFIHQPPELLQLTVALWPFEAWGIDIIGPISLSSTIGHWFILVITDYFSKWVEAIPLIEVKTFQCGQLYQIPCHSSVWYPQADYS